jgi:hypothetical protein
VDIYEGRSHVLLWLWPLAKGILVGQATARVFGPAQAAQWLRTHGYWDAAQLIGRLA